MSTSNKDDDDDDEGGVEIVAPKEDDDDPESQQDVPSAATADEDNTHTNNNEEANEQLLANIKSSSDDDSNDECAVEKTTTKEKLWQRTNIRILLFLLLIVGACIGLAVGLTLNKNSSAAESESVGMGDENGSQTTTLANEDEEEKKVDPTFSSTMPTSSPRLDVVNGGGSSLFPTMMQATDGGLSSGSQNVDDGSCSSTDFVVPTAQQTSSSSSSTCTYQKSQTVQVAAPTIPNSNSSRISGGTSYYDGNTALIVSYNSDGTSGAIWTISKLNAGDPIFERYEQTGLLQTPNVPDQLGWSVSIKRTHAVIGAPGEDGKEMVQMVPPFDWYWAGRGKAIVMSQQEGGDGGEWMEEQVLLPDNIDDTASFGSTVDIAECGCLIAVGAWHDRDSRGSVYIFEKKKDDDGDDGSASWKEVQKLAPVDARRSQSDHLHGNYGYTVALTNDYLAVKAPYDSYLGSYDYYDPNRGMVYVYKRVVNESDGTSSFVEVDRLCTPEGEQVRETLRDVIFLDNARLLLVGAPGKNKVYVFERQGTNDTDDDNDSTAHAGYKKTAELIPSDYNSEESNNNNEGEAESKFGISLSGSSTGTDVLVGDIGKSRSYLFSLEDNNVWKEKAKFDGVNTVMSDGTIVEHTPKSFQVVNNGEEYYGGDVNFYDIICD